MGEMTVDQAITLELAIYTPNPKLGLKPDPDKRAILLNGDHVGWIERLGVKWTAIYKGKTVSTKVDRGDVVGALVNRLCTILIDSPEPSEELKAEMALRAGRRGDTFKPIVHKKGKK